MADIDLSKKPYGSRFNPDDEYILHLFVPDRPVQAAELTELQERIDHDMSNLGGSLFRDGNTQSGMSYILYPGDDDVSERIEISDGYVYLGGKIRKFNRQSIPFNSTGEFKVQVKLVQEVITENEDKNLLDNTLGVPSYLSAGAHRLKETVTLTSDDVEGSDIYIFRDGNLFNQTQTPEISKINDVLAERTYDESGSYIVNGMDLFIDKTTNENTIFYGVEPGRAYVLGYQITKPNPTKLEVPKAQGTKGVQGEVFYYDNRTRRGLLGNSPVKSVNRVTGQVKISRERVTRGAVPNAKDTLNNTPIVSVDEVWTEDSSNNVTQTYVQGVDFQVTGGNAIDWSPTNNALEPASGSTYFVTYVFNDVMEKDVDYKVVNEGNIDSSQTYIDFNGMTGSIPVNNSIVQVDYTYYLAREDLLIMDKDGEITVKQGEYSEFNSTNPPHHEDPFTLIIGSVKMMPNSNNGTVVNSGIKRLDMASLQKMKKRIEDTEYNMAVVALDEPAMAGLDPTTLRGVFSDGFISTDKADLGHPEHTAAYSFEDAEITLPYAQVTVRKPTLLASSSLAGVWGRLVTAPFTERVGVEQLQATEAFNVNPYQVYNKRAILKLDPSEDNWVNESDITVYKDTQAPESESIRLRRWWVKDDSEIYLKDKNLGQFIQLDEGQSWDMRDPKYQASNNDGWITGGYQWDLNRGRTGTILKNGGSQTLDTAIEYMRQIDVNFKGTNYEPNANNLRIIFDGIERPITPASGFSSGSESGTIKANANGEVQGTFTIPSGVRTGTRQVFLQNDGNAGTANFISQGTNRTTENVILREHVTIDLYDPLAQTFQFPTNQTLTSFEFYFASKSNTNNVSVQVRNVTESGFPGKTIYGQSSLRPSQVNVSSDGTKATKVTFDDPMVAEAGKEYAVVILTDSSQYTMHVATIGQTDISSGNTITSNAYNQGILFSSSNASAWTIHQTTDLKFKVNVAEFNETAELLFNTVNDISAESILLLATYLTPENTGAYFQARAVMESEPQDTDIRDKAWVPIENLVDIDLNNIARELQLRAFFKANQNMSPMLSLNDILLTSFLSELEGSYVSRSLYMPEAPFNTLNAKLDVFEPAGTAVQLQYSLDEGDTWETLTNATSSPSEGGFVSLQYNKVLATGNTTYDSIKYKISMESENSFVRPRARRLMTAVTDE